MDTLFIIAANILVAVIGYLLGKYVRRHPEYFWSYLIIGCLSTAPLAFAGFSWYDELFAAFYLLANLPIRLIKSNKLYCTIFVLFSVYMIIQGFRGMINFLDYGELSDSIRKIRWPIFFLLLLGLFYKVNNNKIQGLIDKDLPFKITVFGFFFHIIYIIWGVAALIQGGSEAYCQDAMRYYSDAYGYAPSMYLAIWAPTAYVSSILTIILPAVFITLRYPSRHRRTIGWITLMVIASTVFFFDSRSGSLCLIFLTMIVMPKFGIRRTVVLGVVGIFVFLSITYIASSGGKNVDHYINELKRATMLEKEENYDKEKQDIERKIWMYSAYPALTATPINFLFGYGFRVAGYIVAPYVYEMFAFYGKAKEYADNVSTEAITNIAVDTGIVGLTLFCLLFIFAGREIYKQSANNKWLLMASLGLLFGWLFIINIVDSYLLYLTIIPSGILTQLGKASITTT